VSQHTLTVAVSLPSWSISMNSARVPLPFCSLTNCSCVFARTCIACLAGTTSYFTGSRSCPQRLTRKPSKRTPNALRKTAASWGRWVRFARGGFLSSQCICSRLQCYFCLFSYLKWFALASRALYSQFFKPFAWSWWTRTIVVVSPLTTSLMLFPGTFTVHEIQGSLGSDHVS